MILFQSIVEIGVGSVRDRLAEFSADRLLLRAIHAIGAVPHAQICQPDIAEMGDAEVQALQGSQNTGQSLSAKAGSGWNGPLRALANRYDRDVCLMGAV